MTGEGAARRGPEPGLRPRRPAPARFTRFREWRRWIPVLLGTLLVLASCGAPRVAVGSPPAPAPLVGAPAAAAYTPAELDSVDQDTAMDQQPAPGFTLVDQFGKAVSLADFRGKAVVLSFDDDECTTICPLTGVAMMQAVLLLGPAAAAVQLLGVNANPEHTAVKDVAAFSRSHGLDNRWLFLTGSPRQLQRVWKDYGVYDAVVQGKVDHTPAVYVIDQQGRERRFFATSGDYGVVPVEAYNLARALSAILPTHPRIALPGDLPAGQPIRSPADRVTLPALQPGAPSVGMGGPAPRVVAFFARWAPAAATGLAALDAYARAAAAAGLPGVVAVDVGPVESHPAAARGLTRPGGRALSYPVAVDASGRLADAYGVQGIPWVAVVDGGAVVWSHDGWVSAADLAREVHRALRAGAGG